MGAIEKIQPQAVALRPNGTDLVKPEAAWLEKIELIKQTVAKGCSDMELELFFYTAKKRGLDPLTKQIYAIRRKTKDGEVMTIQTGIDGFRVVAARTGQLAGIEDAQFDSEEGKTPKRATVTAYRLISGVRCPFTATARWDEYKQVKYDGALMGLWAKMPYTMLAKCAEALALRKAFPEDLSGIYTFDEMAQADNGVIEADQVTARPMRRVEAGAVQQNGDGEAQEQKRMEDIAEKLEWIANASNMGELDKLFAPAYETANKLHDHDSLKKLVAAKDAKRKELLR